MIGDINKRDYSISFVRCIAMFSIFLCHILHEYNNILAGWLDVGVQIFFFISGYLYSSKKISSIKTFYVKNLFKLLNDYYIFISIYILILYFLGKLTGISNILETIFLKPSISGLGHLWFIRFILFCYIFTPIFQNILNYIMSKKNRFYIAHMLISAIVIELFFSHILHITGAWFVCYFLGMCYKRIEDNNKLLKLRLFAGVSFITILLCILRIYLYYKSNTPYFTYRYIWCYSHVFLGIFIFFVARYLYIKIQYYLNLHLNNILSISDKYSYDFYIVHYSLIVGYFRIINLTPNTYLNIFIVFLSTCILAKILNLISNAIFIRFKQKLNLLGGRVE